MHLDGLTRKLLWFVGLWVVGVVAVGIVGVVIKMVLGG
jgi:hypothetical protein